MKAEFKTILDAYMDFINKRASEGLMDNDMVRHCFSHPAITIWLNYNYPDMYSSVNDLWLAFNENYKVKFIVEAR